jgi:hypothetical protein
LLQSVHRTIHRRKDITWARTPNRSPTRPKSQRKLWSGVGKRSRKGRKQDVMVNAMRVLRGGG